MCQRLLVAQACYRDCHSRIRSNRRRKKSRLAAQALPLESSSPEEQGAQGMTFLLDEVWVCR